LRGKNPVEFFQNLRGLKKRFAIKYANPAAELKATELIEKAKIILGFGTDAEKARLMAELEKVLKEKEELSKKVTGLQERLKGMGVSSASVKNVAEKIKEGKPKDIKATLKAVGLSEEQIEKLAKDLKIEIVPEAFEKELDVLEKKGIALEAVKAAVAGEGDLTLEQIEEKLQESEEFEEEEIEKFMAVLRDEAEEDDEDAPPPPELDEDDDEDAPPPPELDEDDDEDAPPPPPPGFGEEEVDEKLNLAEAKAKELGAEVLFLQFFPQYKLVKDDKEKLKKQIEKSFKNNDALIAALFEIFELGEHEEAEPAVITPIMQKQSDALFLQELRKAILNFPGPGKFDQYLQDMKNYLKDNVGKKRAFRKKEDLNNVIENVLARQFSIFKERAEEVGLEKYLREMYENLSGAERKESLKHFKDLLEESLYDKVLINQLNDEILSLIVNILVALRKDVKPAYDLNSDAVAIQLFEDLRELKGQFNLPGHVTVETLMSVLEDFKDEQRFFVPVSTKKIEALQKAFASFAAAKDVARWNKEISKLKKQFESIANEVRFKQGLIEAVRSYRQEFEGLQGVSKKIENQETLKNLYGQFKDIAQLMMQAKKQPFYKPAWDEQFKKVRRVLQESLAPKEDGTYKTVKKISRIIKVLQTYEKELDFWAPEELAVLDALQAFHDQVLLERFAVLAREIDLLRINPKFKRYWALLSKDADQILAKEKMFITGKRPFIRMLRGYDLDTKQGIMNFSKDFVRMNFLVAIKKQLLTQPTVGWPEVKEETSARFKKATGDVLEEVIDAFRKFKLGQKKEFDQMDALESLAFVEKLSQVKAALKRLQKQDIDQALLKNILAGIDEGKDPASVVKDIKKLIKLQPGQKLDKEKEITDLLTKNQKASQATALVLKALQEWVGVGKKKFKFEPSSAELRDLLINEAKLDEAEVDKVLKDPFRTANSVKKYLEKKLRTMIAVLTQNKKLGLLTVDKLFIMIEPYGLLLKSLQKISAAKKTSKERAELLNEILTALNIGIFSEQLKKLGLTKGEIEDGQYKGKLKKLKAAFEALDLNQFEDELEELVGKAGLGLEYSDEYAKIVSDTLAYLNDLSRVNILDQLTALNIGMGFLDNNPDKNIVPGILLKRPEGRREPSAAQIRLNDRVLKLLEGRLTDLQEDIRQLVAGQLVNKAKIAANVKAVLDTFKNKLNDLDASDLKLANPNAEKQAVGQKVEAYLLELQKKLEGIIGG